VLLHQELLSERRDSTVNDPNTSDPEIIVFNIPCDIITDVQDKRYKRRLLTCCNTFTDSPKALICALRFDKGRSVRRMVQDSGKATLAAI